MYNKYPVEFEHLYLYVGAFKKKGDAFQKYIESRKQIYPPVDGRLVKK